MAIHDGFKLSLAALLFAACGESGGVATVKGGLSSSEGANTPVEAVQVSNNGEQEVIAEGTTDAQGNFELPIDVPGDGSAGIAIRANGGARGSLVPGRLNAGDRVTLTVMGDESTAEMQVFVGARAHGREDISDLFVLELIDENTGTALIQAGNAIDAAAAAVAAGYGAYADAWALGAIGVSQEAVAAAIEAQAEAMRAQEEALAAAASAEAEAAAAVSYAHASAEAYTAASISLAEHALAIQPAVDIIARGALAIEGAARAELVAAAELRRAYAITAAAEAEIAAAGATAEAQAALHRSGETLVNAIAAAHAASNDAAIHAAWQNYEASLDQALQVTLPAEALTAMANANLALENAAGAIDDALGAINDALGALQNAGVLVGQLGSFYDQALSDAQISLLTAAGITAESARGLLSVRAALEIALR